MTFHARRCAWVLLGSLVACHRSSDGASSARVYVTNEDSRDLAVLDGVTYELVRRIPVGKRPRGVRASADGRTVFVALSGTPKAPPGRDRAELAAPPDRAADAIGVVDVAAGRLVRTLPAGDDPEAFDASPDGHTLFVANEDAGELSFVDVDSGRVTGKLHVGAEPEGVAVRPDGLIVYVACEGDDHVAVVDTRTRERLAVIPVVGRPRGVLFSPDGHRAYVSAEVGGAVVVLDGGRHEALARVPLGTNDPAAPPPRPMGLRLARDGRTLFVSNGRAGTISIVDVDAPRVVGTVVDVGPRPWGLDLSPDGRTLLVANGPSDDVAVVDVERRVVRRRVRVGASPWGVAFGGGAS